MRLDGDVTPLDVCRASRSPTPTSRRSGIALTARPTSSRRRVAGSDEAALELGYLVGAARRGAAHTNGIHAELVRRIEQTTRPDGPPPAGGPRSERGLAAGRARRG